ncbi:Biopolymer transport protein ExbD/TolR [Thermodesulfatator indicus DSM 15286]|uniref:Biopolymer transport protein ExbD/TolR n=1 Tax=Thermodesulfatator indicus (strain DSM 15286 / JCM 11887 / CIR29812) TaxID=667014 RepID=F8ACR7_THEID|nr:biopolymer transporter ExbD [Thermodesulfatator indicus]AEH45848.1 Biopolymer transport protein ExbD/TolR [Thermodesulfatator indicus DSM 15286]
MRKKRRRQDENLEIPMTPIIDIVFLLLIYFLLTSQLVKQKILKVNLPKSETAIAAQQEETVTIGITKDGAFFLNGKQMDLPRLKEELKKLAVSGGVKKVYVEADKDTRAQLLIDAMDAARKAGLKQILLKTKSR